LEIIRLWILYRTKHIGRQIVIFFEIYTSAINAPAEWRQGGVAPHTAILYVRLKELLNLPLLELLLDTFKALFIVLEWGLLHKRISFAQLGQF
jgi:hypothetical protein